jgi:thiamine-monophosphate kinase
VLRAGDVPLSEAAETVLRGQPGRLESVLTGGDDYELLFTVPPAQAAVVAGLAESLGLPLCAIGEMGAGEGVTVVDSAGRPDFLQCSKCVLRFRG